MTISRALRILLGGALAVGGCTFDVVLGHLPVDDGGPTDVGPEPICPIVAPQIVDFGLVQRDSSAVRTLNVAPEHCGDLVLASFRLAGEPGFGFCPRGQDDGCVEVGRLNTGATVPVVPPLEVPEEEGAQMAVTFAPRHGDPASGYLVLRWVDTAGEVVTSTVQLRANQEAPCLLVFAAPGRCGVQVGFRLRVARSNMRAGRLRRLRRWFRHWAGRTPRRSNGGRA